MRLAVITDIHILGPGEHELHREVVANLSFGKGRCRSLWHRFLDASRNRFWNWLPESRYACFLQALQHIEAYHPDWLIANGDYAGDATGTGLSHEATYESAAIALTLIREVFPERCIFNFGDHDIGKYHTATRSGGIRLRSLERGERDLGIESFWRRTVGDIQLIGVNSSLITLNYFLPEALSSEVEQWQIRSEEHLRTIQDTFRELDPSARVILFCHDPAALGILARQSEVVARIANIELTVLGHLHAPFLLTFAQRLPRCLIWKPRYPVARIIAEGIRNAASWAQFNPVVCPSSFGTGHHVSGGVLFIEKTPEGRIVARRHRVTSK